MDEDVFLNAGQVADQLIELLRRLPRETPLVVRIGSKERQAYDVDFVDGEIVVSGL